MGSSTLLSKSSRVFLSIILALGLSAFGFPAYALDDQGEVPGAVGKAGADAEAPATDSPTTSTEPPATGDGSTLSPTPNPKPEETSEPALGLHSLGSPENASDRIAPLSLEGEGEQITAFAVQVGTLDALKAELAKYQNTADDMTITITADITVTETLVIPGSTEGKTLTINSTGSRSLIRDGSFKGVLVNVTGLAQVEFSNLILNGNKVDGTTGSLLHIDKEASVTWLTGAVAKNNTCDLSKGTTLGSGIYNEGSLVIDGGSIVDNRITGRGHSGYGAGVHTSGPLKMISGSVSGNSISNDRGGYQYGGGISVSGAHFEMLGGSISNNSADASPNATAQGGGLHLNQTSSATISGGSISGNSAKGYIALGGGISTAPWGSLKITGGSISNNVAESDRNNGANGGGISFDAYRGGQLIIDGGDISNNKALSKSSTAGGVRVCGELIFKSGTITNNYAERGGGVECTSSSVPQFIGGTISHNKAILGGGIYSTSAALALNGTKVDSNEASQKGGGIWMSLGSATLSAGSITGNKTTTKKDHYGGGGVYVGDDGEFRLQGGVVSGNRSAKDGGGVFLATRSSTQYGSGTLDMSGGQIIDNTADDDGGGVYIEIEQADNFKMTGGLLYGGGWNRVDVVYPDNYQPYTGGAAGNGVLIWRNTKPNTSTYTAGSSTDLNVNSGATGIWSRDPADPNNNGLGGIMYRNGVNSGFIPLGVGITRITAATSAFSFTIPEGHIYSGSPQGIGAVTVRYGVFDNVGTATALYNGNAALPVNAGQYDVSAKVENSPIYDSSSSAALGTYSIAKKSAPGVIRVYPVLADAQTASRYDVNLVWVLPLLKGMSGMKYTLTEVDDTSGMLLDPPLPGPVASPLAIDVASGCSARTTATLKFNVESDNYLPFESTLAVTAYDVPVTITADPEPDDATYDGNAYAYDLDNITATLPGGGGADPDDIDIRWASTDDGGYASSEPPTDAGAYALLAMMKEDSGYTGSAEFGFTIDKASLTQADLTCTLPASLVYDGSPKGISDLSFKSPLSDPDATFTVLYNQSTALPINAGDYSVAIQLQGGKNFEDITTPLGLESYTIEKAPVDDRARNFNVPKSFEHTYNYPLGLFVSDIAGLSDPVYTVKSVENASGLIMDPPNPGEPARSPFAIQVAALDQLGETASTTFTVASGNHEDFDITLNLMTSIALPVEISGVIASDCAYTGEPYQYSGTPIVTGIITGQPVDEPPPIAFYESSDEAGYGSEMPPTEIGSYTVTFMMPEDSVYTGSTTLGFDITKAQADGVDQMLSVLMDHAASYGFDLASLLPAVPGLDDAVFEVVATDDPNALLARAPSGIIVSPLEVAVNSVSGAGVQATISILVTSSRYEDFTVDLVVETYDGYARMTLTDPATHIQVTGRFVPGTTLAVTEAKPCPNADCPACKEITAMKKAGKAVVLYDVAVHGPRSGPIEVSFPVDERYNGIEMRLIHCAEGRLDERQVTPSKGRVVESFDTLSPIALVDKGTGGDKPTPTPTPTRSGGTVRTGDSSLPMVIALGSLLVVAGLAVTIAVIRGRRHKKG